METTRRDFMKTSLVVAGFSGLALREAPPAIKKGLVFDMVPAHLSYADRFKLVRDAGFEVVQALTEPDERKAEEMKEAAAAVNIRIDSDECRSLAVSTLIERPRGRREEPRR